MARIIFVVWMAMLIQSCSFSDEPLESFSSSVQGVFSAAYSTDGHHTVVGSIQHGGSLWDVASAERLFNWNHQQNTLSQITSVAFSPEGDFVLTADEDTLVLWEVNTGKALRFFNAPSSISHIALSPNAKTALLGLVDGNSVLFDIQRGGVIGLLEQGRQIVSMAMSSNGDFALFGLDNRQAVFWNLQSMERLYEINTQGRVQTVALSNDGRFGLLTVQHVDAVVWDMRANQQHAKLKYSNKFFPSFSSFVTARFNKEGSQIITGNTTGAMELWSRDNGERLNRWITPFQSGIKPEIFSVIAVALDEQLNHIFAMTSDGTSYRYRL